MSNINTSSAWDSIKTYLANFTHGLDSEIKHIEEKLGLIKVEAPKEVKAPKAAKVEAASEEA
jgi:hypothetical protein